MAKNPKILDEENKIITVIKMKEKNLLDLQKKISKVVEKIQKFKLTKKRELDKFERKINQYKVSKEKISSRQITFNQQLNVELSLCKDVEIKLKDKILEAASEVKAIEDKISFKSGSTYATFMKQTIDIDESQASVLVSDSILNHQNSISLIKKDLRVEKQELSKNISNHKKDIKKIRSKISLAKKDIFTLNKKISATEKSQRKFNLPLSKLIQSQELLVKEKDLAEKSFISLQVKEQENLDALVQKRTALEDEYNKNANKLDKIYKAKLNELKNRIKNQEDLRLMKIFNYFSFLRLRITNTTIAITIIIGNATYAGLNSDSSATEISLTKIVVSYGRKISSLTLSLYRTVIVISCSPYCGSPSNAIGILNGTGASVSISSIN